MKKFIAYRLKRKLLVNNIKNEIVKNNYIRYLNSNYLYMHYKTFLQFISLRFDFLLFYYHHYLVLLLFHNFLIGCQIKVLSENFI